jgi:hypothetical protein
METLNTIQQLAPATTVAALLALPWVTAFFMHLAGSLAGAAHDDKWNLRAAAAQRWADTLGAPRKSAVIAMFAARRPQYAAELPRAA